MLSERIAGTPPQESDLRPTGINTSQAEVLNDSNTFIIIETRNYEVVNPS